MTDFGMDVFRIVTTRADLIASGDLIPAPDGLDREAGWAVPVALTSGAFDQAVRWSQDDGLQSETGRWWDVLFMGRMAAKRGGSGPRPFSLLRVPNRPGAWSPVQITLVLNVGPGDEGEPVITITTTDESR